MPFANRKYFLASNSKNGFINYFSRVFNEENCQKIYIIKGGSGTGKSRFMRDVGSFAEKEGMAVNYYYCSSDSASLDGIIIKDLRVGILDGTFPHVFEPTAPGAFEEILNFGDFWNGDKLSDRRDEIKKISAKKSTWYKRAYKLLSSFGELLSVRDDLIRECVCEKKLDGAVKRLLHRLPSCEKGNAEIGLCRSTGMDGDGYFDTYEKSADVLYTVSRFHGVENVFLDRLKKETEMRNISCIMSLDPIMNDRIDAIEFTDLGISFVIGEGGEKHINMCRFTDIDKFKERKLYIRDLEHNAKEIKKLIEYAFSNIKSAHFALEEIYFEAMDFEKKERFTDNFIRKLFENEKKP